MVAPLLSAFKETQPAFYLVIIFLFFALFATLLCCLYCCIRKNCNCFRRSSTAGDEVDLIERPQIQEHHGVFSVPRSIISRFSRRQLTRAAALQSIRERRELMLEDGVSNDSEMERLYEQAIDSVLAPRARAPDERSDVDLDLHRLRRRDAEQLVRRLLARANSHSVAQGIGIVHTFIDENHNQLRRHVLRIDAGRGTHSPNGIPVLQHAVRDLLDCGGVRYTTLQPPHEGTFLIDYRSASVDESDVGLIEA